MKARFSFVPAPLLPILSWAALALLVLASRPAQAASAIWSGAAADGNQWSTTGNWSASPVPGTGDTATFNSTATNAGVIDLGTGVTVGRIDFNDATIASFTLGAGAANSQTLTLTGVGGTGLGPTAGTFNNATTLTVNASLFLNASMSLRSAGGPATWVFNGDIAPASSLNTGTIGMGMAKNSTNFSTTVNGVIRDGAGGALLQLSGVSNILILTNANNSFTGGIVINNTGSLSVDSIGNGTNSHAGKSGTITMGDGFGRGALKYTGSGATVSRPLQFGGPNTGIQGGSSAGMILDQSGTGLVKYTSDLTFVANSSSKQLALQGSTAGTGEVASTVTDGSSATHVNGASAASAGATTLTMSASGNTKAPGVGDYVSAAGGGIPAGTYVAAWTSPTLTLSAPLSGAVAAGETLTFSGVTSLGKTGTGTWTMSGANTFRGVTSILQGNLRVASLNYVSSGTLASHATASNLGIPADVYHGTIGIGNGANAGQLTYAGTGETTDRVINLAGNTSTGNATLDQSGTGLLKFTSAFTSTGAGPKTLLLQGSTAGTGEIASAIVDNSAANKTSLTKAGTGMWTLSGASTFSGTATITGGTLRLDASTGSLLGNAGTLPPLTFSGSGTFQYDGTSASGVKTQSLGALSISVGEGTVQTIKGTATSSTLTFASLGTRGGGAAGNFLSGGTTDTASKITFTTAPTAGQLMDKGYYFSGSNFAAYDAAGYVRALNYATTGGDTNTVDVGTITGNRHVKLTTTPANQNSITLTTLNLTGSVNWTQNAAQTLTCGSILKTGGGTSTISGGTAVTAGSNIELVIRTDTSADVLDIAVPLTQGSGILTKAGAGTLTLSATGNTYTGATRVNAGTLLVNGTITGAGAVTVYAGATLAGSGTLAGALTVQSGGTIQPSLTGSANTLTFASATAPTLNAGSVLKVRAPSATLDKVSSAAATLNITGTDLVIDTTGLIGNVLSTTIVQLTGASPVITGPFRSVTVVGNTDYVAALDYSTAGQVKVALTNSLSAPSAFLIQVAGSGSATMNAGSNVSLTVTALNPSGTALTTFSGDVTLSFYGLSAAPNSTAPVITDKNGVSRSITATASTPNVTLSFVNGVATVSGANNGLLTAFNAATATLHCSDSVVTSASGTGAGGLALTVNPAALASYSVTATSPQVTITPFLTTVTALDAYGNIVTTDSSTVVTMTSSGNAQFDSNGDSTFDDNAKTLTNGTFTISTKDDVVETMTLTATSAGGKTGTSASISFNPSSSKDILTFTFPSYGAAIISGTNITKTLPFGSSVTSLAPTYTMSGGASGSPVSGTTLDFTTPQTYTITAADSSTKVYTVTVTVAPQPTTFTWASATSGNFSAAANWTNNVGDGTAPAAAGFANYTLNFTPTGTYTATHDLNNGFLLNQANFTGTVTLAGTSGLTFTNNGATLPTINHNSSNAVTISAPISLAANTTVGGTAAGNVTFTLSGGISGAGTLIKQNTAILSLSTASNYSGGTIVNGGSLRLATTNNTLMGTGTVTVNSGATLNLNGNNNLTNTFEFNNATVTNGNSFSAVINGPVTFTGSTVIDFSTTGNMVINGTISGTGGFIKRGISSGSLTLTANNSFSGAVSIQAGSITVASLNSVSGGTATSNLGAPTTVPNGTISIGSTTTGATLTYSGNGETTDRVISLAGTTGGATITQAGNALLSTTRGQSGLLKFTSNLSIPGTAGADNRKTLTLNNAPKVATGSSNGQGEISGSIGDSLLGNPGQTATSIIKSGSGTWILSGVNTYTGSTSVQAGTLVIKRPEALGAGALDITAGAKLQLDYLGTRPVTSLNGSATPSGTYGSSASPATFKDDTRFSGPGTITLGTPSSSPNVALVLSSGSNPSNGGASITFTATVTGSTPTGLVYFYDGLTQIGAASLNGSAQSTFSTALLTGGSHTITAFYAGDGNNGSAVSTSLTQTINDTRPASTTALALTSGTNPSAFGATIAFTATVTGSSPTGSVAFYDGSTLLGTRPLNGSAQATLSTNGLAAGWRSITASYLGDAANAPSSTSSALFQNITPPAGNGRLKVFILAGQSNMQGKGRVELGRDPNNYNNTNFAGGLGSLRNMLNKNPNTYGYLADTSPLANTANTTVPGWRTLPNVWVSYFTSGANASATQARKGFLDADFGNGASSGQIGPEYGFGLVVGSQLGDPVLIIKTAWGGNSLAWNFRPPSSGTTTITNVNTMRDAYNFMVADVRFILNNLSTELTGFAYNPANGYEIAGFGWHQGWNDRINSLATAEYETNLTNLINDIRAEFGVPNLPFVIGTTSMANVDGDTLGQQLVAAQKAVANPALHPEFAGTVATIDTKAYDYGTDASPSSEGFHWNWNAESYFNIGEKMGQAMIGLLSAQSSAKDIVTFSIPGQVSSSITGTNVSVLMPFGTNVTALAPSITLSSLASATPVSGTARDFTSPQTYTVTAQNLTTKTYTVTVSVSPSIYSDWSLNPSLGLTSGVNDGLSADPDSDGLINLIEWGFGMHPTVSGSPLINVTSGVLTQRGMPSVQVQNIVNGVDYRALFGRRKNYLAAGLTYSVQFSADLSTWQTSAATPTVVADDGEIEAVTVPYPLFVGGKKARFFRVVVSVTP